MNIQSNYNLKSLNTFGINVSCKYFTQCNTIENIQSILSDKSFEDESRLILGGGSNILFTKNFDGLVIKNDIKGIELLNEDIDYFYVKAGAGEVWHDFVLFCIKNNYAGLENLSLIPGNVGASPMQNIGAYGVEIKDVFYELEAFNIKEKVLQKFNSTECKFGYRESIFKKELKNQFIITSVTFKLRKKPLFNTSYGAIEDELKKMNITTLSIKAISDAVCNIRNSKLPNPKEIGNAGSFFKNPEISTQQFNSLKILFPNIIGYPLDNEKVKLAAGWLIEQAGWKGKTFGDAGVHKLQALVLVNYKNAKGEDLFNLSSEIINSVYKKFGVELEREVNII